MKIRDSGMPDEQYWESLFDVPLVLSRLGIEKCHDVAELGCGYGTFSIPIAKVISGTLYAYDVEPAMLSRTAERGAGLSIVCEQRDIVSLGFAVEVDAVLLFNILHCDNPVDLLKHAANSLLPGGRVLAIHWNHGQTPRGPSLSIRPKPEQVIEWAAQVGLQLEGGVIDLPPWHYGLIFEKRA